MIICSASPELRGKTRHLESVVRRICDLISKVLISKRCQCGLLPNLLPGIFSNVLQTVDGDSGRLFVSNFCSVDFPDLLVHGDILIKLQTKKKTEMSILTVHRAVHCAKLSYLSVLKKQKLEVH